MSTTAAPITRFLLMVIRVSPQPPDASPWRDGASMETSATGTDAFVNGFVRKDLVV